MAKEMIISVNGREKKIAILENGYVTEFYIERGDEENSGVVGNIYKGRVQRVLPGMQSAFVGIGLERDAFLYVSDFFDEEEEIERIIQEKSKKVPAEMVEREVSDELHRARLEREKQMEAAQEIAEPLSLAKPDEIAEYEERAAAERQVETAATEMPAAEAKGGDQQKDKRGRSKRGGKGRNNNRDDFAADNSAEKSPESQSSQISQPEETEITTSEKYEDEAAEEVEIPLTFEFEDSGFERVVDDEETGEMFKDAYLQEAIVDRVRAVEFDMESTATAEVGSLLDSTADQSNGFERIADDEDEPTVEKKTEKKSSASTGRRKGSKRDAKKQMKKIEEVSAEDANPDQTANNSSRTHSQH